MICAVKTERMKRKTQVTREEALDLVVRSCIKKQFHEMETRHQSQVIWCVCGTCEWIVTSLFACNKKKARDPSPDLDDGEWKMVDEVYSDEFDDVCTDPLAFYLASLGCTNRYLTPSMYR